ncbi:MAG: hypothetical protein HGA78_05245, partial [Nitrospirales bacterium]|nr:hypothetical protein [Nitrospirales bacterium]
MRSKNTKAMKGVSFIAMVVALVMFGSMAVPTEKSEAGLLGGSATTGLVSSTVKPLAGLLDPVLNVLGSTGLVGGLLNNVNNLVQSTLLYNVNVGGITGPVIATVGNTVCPTVEPLVQTVKTVGNSLSISTIQPLLKPVAQVADAVAGLVVEGVVNNVVLGVMEAANEIAGGEVKALIPMPLDPSRSCEDCHNSRANLIAAMVDPANNAKYPGLAADVPFVDNFYVDPSYTSLPDSMMSKAVKHTLWNGCQTCHGTGATFDPFPSDNWVPRSNPNDGPETAWALGSTNNTSNSCGKCHADQADAVNNGIMGTHRGHLAAFNYNDV